MDLIAVLKGIFHSFHLTFVVTLPVVFWRKKSSPVLIQRETLMVKSGEEERELQRKIKKKKVKFSSVNEFWQLRFRSKGKLKTSCVLTALVCLASIYARGFQNPGNSPFTS